MSSSANLRATYGSYPGTKPHVESGRSLKKWRQVHLPHEEVNLPHLFGLFEDRVRTATVLVF